MLGHIIELTNSLFVEATWKLLNRRDVFRNESSVVESQLYMRLVGVETQEKQ